MSFVVHSGARRAKFWRVLAAVLGPRGEGYRRGETKKVNSHSLLAPIGVLGDISIYKHVCTVYIYIYII